MPCAAVTDGTNIWPLLSHDRQKSHMAFARQRDRAARKHPAAVGRPQQADHHGRIARGSAARFWLVRRLKTASIQLEHTIHKEKDQSALGQLGGRAMRL